MKILRARQAASWFVLTGLWTAVLLIVVSLGGGVLLLAAQSSLPFPLVAALLATATLFVIIRQQSRNRALRRQAALDAYVARELARAAKYNGNNRTGLAPAHVPVLNHN
jgi:hypothetical protein